MFFGGDPFEHFAHGGGGGSRRSARPSADVDTNKLYETLGVSAKMCIVSSTICHFHELALQRLDKKPEKKNDIVKHHESARNDFTFECMPPQSD
jgi:hypothetical protein